MWMNFFRPQNAHCSAGCAIMLFEEQMQKTVFVEQHYLLPNLHFSAQ
jgi:hypothetical protein